MKTKFLFLLLLQVPFWEYLSAQNPSLVVDINTDPLSLIIYESGLLVYNDRLYFSAVDNAGPYLWSTDGTMAGTTRDLKPGINYSADGPLNSRCTVSDGFLYYCAGATDVGANQLWKTDGTPGGSQLLGGLNCNNLIDLSGIIYFSATDAAHGNEIWRTDGTPAGTYLFKDIVAGANSSDPLSPAAILGNKIIFNADYGLLYVTDGTTAGTFPLQQNSDQEGYLFYDCMVNFQGAVYFIIRDDLSNASLWKTDGTVSGTVLVKGIETSLTFYGDVADLVVAGNQLFFMAETEDFGKELWVSDGTSEGTKMVADIRPGTEDGLWDGSYGLYPINDKVYFGANDGMKGNEPWCSDGTAAGTQRITDLKPNGGSSDPFSFVALGDKILFSARMGGLDNDLFITDGTAAGTSFLSETPFPSTLYFIASFGGKIYYINDLVYQRAELWVTDGTVTGTQQFEIPIAQNASSMPAAMVSLGPSKYIFSIWDDDSLSQMWFTDGTTAGSEKIFTNAKKDEILIAPEALNGTAFFVSLDSAYFPELWKTDGTVQGTVKVKNMEPYFDGGTVILNNLLYFIGNDLTSQYHQLWRTDGTEAGTYPVSELDYSAADNLVLYYNHLFFSAGTDSYGFELWTSDGTAAGTMMFKDIKEGTGSAYPDNIASANGKLYFAAETNDVGLEPWISDGTPDGTVLLKDALAGINDSDPGKFTAIGDFVYFSAADVLYTKQLWKTDGTNTTIILDGIDGYDGYSLSEFTEYNGRLYFVIGHSMLATLNDAETKTESVYEMAGEISNLHEVNNELYFTVMNTDNFFPVGHLWQSNGTTSGTYQLDFFPAVVSELSTEVSGQILLTDGNLMFLGLNDEATGTELWKYEAAGNTGIQNHVSNSSLLNVFPNPSSSGVFQFNVPELKNPALLELSDISGRKVYEEKIGNGSGAIDISGFSKGLYVLTISNQELRSVSKLIYE